MDHSNETEMVKLVEFRFDVSNFMFCIMILFLNAGPTIK